jgi:hypothetical protein
MAVHAHDLALRDLVCEHARTNTPPHKSRDLGSLGTDVIELEYDGIDLPAVTAGMRKQVGENKFLRLANAAGLERVATASVVCALLLVVRLEAVATPPLEPRAEPVEAALGT